MKFISNLRSKKEPEIVVHIIEDMEENGIPVYLYYDNIRVARFKDGLIEPRILLDFQYDYLLAKNVKLVYNPDATIMIGTPY